MGLFGGRSEGGLMDVIRCDEQEYLVWKWRGSGEANSTKKENEIKIKICHRTIIYLLFSMTFRLK